MYLRYSRFQSPIVGAWPVRESSPIIEVIIKSARRTGASRLYLSPLLPLALGWMKKRRQKDVKAPPSPLRLFGVFAWISAVTIGGGYAMVPVIGSILEKRGWATEDEFYDIFAAAQSFPGPLAYTTALVAGRKLGGPAGAAASAIGVILPPFIAIVAVATLLGRFGELPPVKAFLDGAGATVPGLVAAMLWKIAKRRSWTVPRAVGTAAAAAALILAPRESLPIFLGSCAILYLVEKRWNS
jgi:chromate transporter